MIDGFGRGAPRTGKFLARKTPPTLSKFGDQAGWEAPIPFQGRNKVYPRAQTFRHGEI